MVCRDVSSFLHLFVLSHKLEFVSSMAEKTMPETHVDKCLFLTSIFFNGTVESIESDYERTNSQRDLLLYPRRHAVGDSHPALVARSFPNAKLQLTKITA